MRLSFAFHRSDRSLWLVQLLLGTAVGATTAALLLVDTVVWRPVQARDLDRIVTVGGLAIHPSLGDAVEWWSKIAAFEHLARYRTGDAVIDAGAEKKWVRVTEVSASFDEIFGMTFGAGRGCSKDDEGQSDSLAFVSRSFWESRFRSDQQIIGRVMQLGDGRISVIGVLDTRFSFPSSTDIWMCRRSAGQVPFGLVTGADSLPPVRTSEGWVALLREGVFIKQASDEARALLKFTNAQLSPKSGVMYGDIVSISPLRLTISRNAAPTLYLFLGACGCLLLLAALNSTFHFLALVTRRRTDFAIRRALGGSHWQAATPLVRLAAMGGFLSGVAGILAGAGCLGVARYFLFAFRVHIPPINELMLLLGLTSAALGSAVGLVSGVFPALLAGSSSPAGLLRRQQGSSSPSERVLRRTFLVVQLGLATVLLIGGIATTRTYFDQMATPRGHDPENVVVLYVVAKKNEQGTLPARYVLDAARSAPGVRAVAVTSQVLVSSKQRSFRSVTAHGSTSMVATVDFAGDYFDTLGIKVHPSGVRLEPNEVVINSKLASHLWSPEAAVGNELLVDGDELPRKVAGVSSNTQAFNEAEPPFEIFRPISTLADFNPSVLRFRLLVRTDLVTPAFVQELLSALPRDLSSQVVRTDVLSDAIRREMAPQRAQAVVWLIFAGLGLLVSLAGVSGLVAYLVSERRFEIGVRAACGATPISLVILLSKEGLACVILGVGLGLVSSLAIAKLAGSLLVGLQRPDFATALVASLVILIVGSAAATAPAMSIGSRATGFLRD